MTGKELKLRIDKIGVTQRKLAEDLGVTPQTVSAILTAKDVRTSTIERIASVTNMPISFFFKEEHDTNNAIASGDSAVAVNTNTGSISANGSDTTALKEQIAMLEKLLDEKERTIKILLEKR